MNYETLHQVISEVESKYQIVFPMVTGGIGYGESRRWHLTPNYKLEKISPRSKKMVQVVVNRLDHGRYELIDYIL